MVWGNMEKLSNKSLLIILGLAILLIVIFFGFKGGNTDKKEDPDKKDVSEITSDDGLASLEIPKNALPKNVNLEDIKIEKISDGNFSFDLEDGNLEGYRLLPDGLELKENVYFKTNISNDDNTLPLIFHVTEEEVNLVEGVAYTINGDEVEISAPVKHFSEIVYDSDIWNIKVSAEASDASIGENVESKFVASIAEKKDFEFFRDEGMFLIRWKVKVGTFKVYGDAFGDEAVSPEKVKDVPVIKSGENTYTLSPKGFSCLGEEDENELTYQVILTYWTDETTTKKSTGYTWTKEEVRSSSITVKTNLFKCKLDLGVPIITVVDKECTDPGVSQSGRSRALCKWKFQYEDGSPLKCGTGDLREPLTEMLGEDGKMHKALFEIIEKREVEGEVYNYVGVQALGPVINPAGNGVYVCRKDELGYTVYNIEEGETVEVGIQSTNDDYLFYDGDGDYQSVKGLCSIKLKAGGIAGYEECP